MKFAFFIILFLGLFFYFWLFKSPSSHKLNYDNAVFNALSISNPIFVHLSPDSRYILTKTKKENEFDIAIVDRKDYKIVKKNSSNNTQLSLTWSPFGDKILYQSCNSGDMEFKLSLWNLEKNNAVTLDVPTTFTAVPPIKWSSLGNKILYYVGDGRQGRVSVIEICDDRVKSICDLGEVTPDGDFDWSPDGLSCVVTSIEKGDIEIVSNGYRQKDKIKILEDGDIRDIIWSPNGNYLLVTIRSYLEDYNELWIVNVKTKNKKILLHLNNSDVRKPKWLKDSKRFIYQFCDDERIQIGMTDIDLKSFSLITNNEFVNEIVDIDVKKDILFFLQNNLHNPPEIFSVVLNDTSIKELIWPIAKVKNKNGISPEMIHLKSNDSADIPCFLWRKKGSKTTDSSRVLIYVHGGPNMKESPKWDPGIQLLSERGISFISFNYHGSIGYGVHFEKKNDITLQVNDIFLVREYIKSKLKLSNQQVYLFGSSYGTRICIEAVKKDPAGFGGLVLVSNVDPPDCDFSLGILKMKLVFQGKQDHYAAIRAKYDDVFNNQYNWFMYENEGHFFHHISTWAEIYTEILNHIYN